MFTSERKILIYEKNWDLAVFLVKNQESELFGYQKSNPSRFSGLSGQQIPWKKNWNKFVVD